MPALVCSASLSEPLAVTGVGIKKRQHQHMRSYQRTVFTLPELCDLIARHLDRHSLTIVVRVCSLWYGNWIRHLWRRVRVESGAAQSLAMANAFPRLSHHIHQLEWVKISGSDFSVHSADLSRLNVKRLLLSTWSDGLDEETLARLVGSSAKRLSVLQLLNMAQIQGDLMRVAKSLPSLQHFSLTMADRDCSRNHPRQQSLPLSSSSIVEQGSASPSNSITALDSVISVSELAVTSADSLPDLMDACPKLRTIELLELPSSSHGAGTTTLIAMPDAVSDTGSTDGASDTMTYTDTANSASEPANDAVKPMLPLLPPMKHLTIINLHATSVSGRTLSVLFARCPQLVKLNLGQNSTMYLTGFHLDPLLIMENLSTVLFSGCHFLDGHGYKEIFKASPNLLTLEIANTNVDDSALAVLGHHCLQIMDLNLDGCLQITDQGIRDMFSPRPYTAKETTQQTMTGISTSQEPYQNYHLQCLSVSNCTELTGQGIHYILTTCAALRNLEFQQPEIMPESLFPHTLEADDQEEPYNLSASGTNNSIASLDNAHQTAAVYPAPETEEDKDEDITVASPPWACRSTLETLRIKNLNVINQDQTWFLNARLRELSQLKVLHIGGSQLELSVLNGLGHQLQNLYIDDLAREVDLEDVRWLVDHTPNLTRLWCRQLIRHSEPWKLLRAARKHLKLW
ncbi:hypothetical protein BGX28_001904 [Mortierella sp. GBA30]|nr:hypothetical protein BGX28_001904 [Mortierella sp. GBA30]